MGMSYLLHDPSKRWVPANPWMLEEEEEGEGKEGEEEEEEEDGAEMMTVETAKRDVAMYQEGEEEEEEEENVKEDGMKSDQEVVEAETATPSVKSPTPSNGPSSGPSDLTLLRRALKDEDGMRTWRSCADAGVRCCHHQMVSKPH